MIQGGRSGVARYVIELAKQLVAHDQVDLRIQGLAHEQSLLPQSKGGFVGLPACFQRGAVDALRCMLHAPARPGAILHVPSYRRVPWIHNGPVVTTIHDLAPLHMKNKYGWARYHFIKDIVPVGVRRCDHIITVTEHTRQDVITHFGIEPSRISVAPCGLITSVFVPVTLSVHCIAAKRSGPIYKRVLCSTPRASNIPAKDIWPSLMPGRTGVTRHHSWFLPVLRVNAVTRFSLMPNSAG